MTDISREFSALFESHIKIRFLILVWEGDVPLDQLWDWPPDSLQDFDLPVWTSGCSCYPFVCFDALFTRCQRFKLSSSVSRYFTSTSEECFSRVVAISAKALLNFRLGGVINVRKRRSPI